MKLRRCLAMAAGAGLIATGLLIPNATAEPPPTVASAERASNPLDLHPTPQQVTPRPDGFPLTPAVTVVSGEGTDPAALRELHESLRQAGVTRITEESDRDEVPDSPVTFYVGGTSENGLTSAALDSLGVEAPQEASDEAYVLAAGRDRDGDAVVVLAGAGRAGTFYAAQTFEQAMSERNGLVRIPGLEVRDHPAMTERGVIEGFYGDPWTHADRLSQLEFYGEQKLNTYVYAPKDDPYHREQWREPYPAAELRRIGELAGTAEAEHVRFVFSISPGSSICYSDDADFQALVAKSQSVWDAGVRSFEILLDDIDADLDCTADRELFGEDSSPAAAAQAFLLNRFQEEFLDRHAGARRLVTVPTEYSGLRDTPYRSRLAELLDPRIGVYWTGREVISPQITGPDAAAAHDIFGHDIVLWDNYPVNDYQRDRLFMGPLVGRDPDLPQNGVIGLVSNPMNQAEASKVPLFTVADFVWNPPAYEPESSWSAAVSDFAGDAADAMRVFAENSRSSILSAVESPTLTPLIDAYWESLGGDGPRPAGAELAQYFDAMATAPQTLRSEVGNAAFVTEVEPWLDKLGAYGGAGAAAVEMLEAESDGDWTAAWQARIELESAATVADGIAQTMAPGVVDPFLERARNQSRLVTVTRPADGATLPAGDDVEVAAEVHAGAMAIEQVEFYAGPVKIGVDTTAPYETTWTNPPDGEYTVYAVAHGVDGNAVRSAAVRAAVGDPKDVLYVAGSTDLSEGDAHTVERLRYLGYPVTVMSATESGAADAEGKAAVLVSSTVASGAVGSDFTSADVPVMAWESYVFDDLGMSTQVGEEWNRSDIDVTAPSHPAAAGRSGTVTVYKGLDRLRWGDVAPDGAVIATLPDDPARATLFAYDQGQQMFTGAAPARRVGIFLGDTGTSVLTEDGMAMFDAAVGWLTGRS